MYQNGGNAPKTKEEKNVLQAADRKASSKWKIKPGIVGGSSE
jgi:hypothetical protein